MVDPPENASRLSASRAWMRRVARVSSRRNQVWSRTDARVEETFVVIGDPQLACDWAGGGQTMRNLANFLTGLSKGGWCHEVFRLETGQRHFMNESFFAEGELGSPAVYGRLA